MWIVWWQVSDQKKDVGSTEGMQTTVLTSELMQHRIDCVDRRMEDMIDAIRMRDFPSFAKLTMQVCLTIHLVNGFNSVIH